VSWLSRLVISPKTEFGVRLRKGLFLGLLGVAFILLYIVDFAFADVATDVPRFMLPLVGVGAVGIIYLARDSLRYPGAAADRHVSFFQSQYPKVYLEQHYRLPPSEARERWLSVLRQWRDRSHPSHDLYARSLRTSYECRLVYYLQWLLPRAFWLCVLALAVLAVLTLGVDAGLSPSFTLHNTALTGVRIAFPVLLLVFYMHLRLSNRPDPDGPTGAWLRWKEINDDLKSWWDRNQAR